jgi:tetratricopeptide (TPR) repeat protein
LRNIRFAITTLLLILFLFFLFAWFSPSYWNWSVFNFTQIWTINFIIIAFITALLFSYKFSVYVHDKLTNLLQFIHEYLSKLPSPLRLILWILVPMAIFFSLKSNCHIHGDGNLILSHIVNDILVSSTAPGVSLLVRFIYKITEINPTALMQGISIICGVVFVYFTYKILYILIPELKTRLALFCILTTSSIIIVFTGYIETYPILIAWLSLYLYFALRFLKTSLGFSISLILFFLGIFWHIWFVAFLPSLLFLIVQRFAKINSKLLILSSMLFVSGIYLGGLFIKRTGIPLVIPMLPNDSSRYVIFSSAHLLDFMNQLIIIGPVMTFLTILLILLKSKDKFSRSSIFLLYASMPALFISFILDPALGAIRDWDLLSIYALPLFLVGVILLDNILKVNTSLRYLIIPILLIGLIHTSGFVLNNKNEDQAVTRVVEILKHDPHYQADYHQGKRNTPFATILSNVYSRYEDGTYFMKKIAKEEDKTDYTDYLIQANQYYNSEDYANTQHYYSLIPNDLLPELKNYFAYGESLYLTGYYAKAVEQLRIVLEDSSFSKLHYLLGSAYLGEDNPDSAIKYYDLSYEDQIDTIDFLQNAAHNFSHFEYYNYALEYYKRLYDLNPELQGLNNDIATTYHFLRQTDSAYKYYSLVLEDDPESYNALLNVSQLHIEKNDYNTAISFLDHMDSLYSDDAKVLTKIGFTLQKLDRHEEALYILNRAIEIAPQDIALLHLIAREYYLRDSIKTAIAYWDNIIALDSGYAPAYYCLAECYDKMDEDLMAEKELRSWLRINPSGRQLNEAKPILKKYGLID